MVGRCWLFGKRFCSQRESAALVAAHNLDVKFVCCIDQDDAVLSRDDVKTVMLPFRVDGSLEFRRCGLYQLGKTMPELPDGLVFDLPSKDVPRHVDLVTLRLRVPKSFVSVECWKAFKERPVEGAKEW